MAPRKNEAEEANTEGNKGINLLVAFAFQDIYQRISKKKWVSKMNSFRRLSNYLFRFNSILRDEV